VAYVTRPRLTPAAPPRPRRTPAVTGPRVLLSRASHPPRLPGPASRRPPQPRHPAPPRAAPRLTPGTWSHVVLVGTRRKTQAGVRESPVPPSVASGPSSVLRTRSWRTAGVAST